MFCSTRVFASSSIVSTRPSARCCPRTHFCLSFAFVSRSPNGRMECRKVHACFQACSSRLVRGCAKTNAHSRLRTAVLVFRISLSTCDGSECASWCRRPRANFLARCSALQGRRVIPSIENGVLPVRGQPAVRTANVTTSSHDGYSGPWPRCDPSM